MGLYLNQDGDNLFKSPKGKADALIANGATELKHPQYLPFLVCVIDNGSFEAAGFIFSRREFGEFLNNGTMRFRRWLIAEKAIRKQFRPETIEMHLADVKGPKTFEQLNREAEEIEHGRAAHDSICSKICGETYKHPCHIDSASRVVDVIVVCMRPKGHSLEFHVGWVGNREVVWRYEQQPKLLSSHDIC